MVSSFKYRDTLYVTTSSQRLVSCEKIIILWKGWKEGELGKGNVLNKFGRLLKRFAWAENGSVHTCFPRVLVPGNGPKMNIS